MLKRRKEILWVVIVSCLVADEKDQTKMLARDYATEVKAHTAEIACWRTIKMLWQDAAKQNVSQPIFNVKAMKKEQYDEAVKLAEAQKAGEEAFGPATVEGEAPIVELPKPEADNGIPTV